MEKFTNITSTAIPLPIKNIDTDQIIPARFLKATNREGFGVNLFRDWRFNKNGEVNTDFILNNPAYKGSILITDSNFGCGSSREHAAWAVHDYGLRVVISSFIADIFKGNALNNGILPVQVSESFLKLLLTKTLQQPETEITVNLEKQTVSIKGTDQTEKFTINPYKKICLQNGFSDLDYLVSVKDKIEAYEATKKVS